MFGVFGFSNLRDLQTPVARNSHFYPVILAGGRGTRFWPLSRKKPRQATARTRRQADHDPANCRAACCPSLRRNDSGSSPTKICVRQFCTQLPKFAEESNRSLSPQDETPRRQSAWRHFFCSGTNPDACIGMFPSDHVIADEKRYRETLAARHRDRGRRRKHRGARAFGRHAPKLAMATSRPERLMRTAHCECADSRKSRTRQSAAEFVAAGNYFWNSGMFLWSARTLANALREHLPKTARLLEKIAAAFGTRKFAGDISQALSKMRKHQRRLRDPRAAVGQR